MSDNKHRKFLDKTQDIANDLLNRNKVAIVLSDSKGRHLHDQLLKETHQINELEQGISWSYEEKWSTDQAIGKFISNFQSTSKTHGTISLFVWLGTYDLVESIGDYIRLKFNYKDIAQKIITSYRDLSGFANENHFVVTFLEIPYLSTAIFNTFKGHPDPDIYVDSDEALCQTISEINKVIREINSENGTHSHMLNCDLEKSQKNKGRNSKKFTNFYQLEDGIHPKDLLCEVWLRKLTILIKENCY